MYLPEKCSYCGIENDDLGIANLEWVDGQDEAMCDQCRDRYGVFFCSLCQKYISKGYKSNRKDEEENTVCVDCVVNHADKLLKEEGV